MPNEHVRTGHFGLGQHGVQVLNNLVSCTEFDELMRSDAANHPRSRIALSFIGAVVTANAGNVAHFRHDLVPGVRVASETGLENDSWAADTNALHVKPVPADIHQPVQHAWFIGTRGSDANDQQPDGGTQQQGMSHRIDFR
jgi:hypothetical protein